MIRLIQADLRRKALWCYENDRWPTVLKVLLTDGTPAMLLYRLMQWSRRHRLVPLELIFSKLNAICCHCIIGRGAEFGPGFVLIHSTGVVINGRVRGGSNVHIEHQVTIGAERRQYPVLGDDIFIGAGAKILGPITIGNGARIGANAVVLHDVPSHATAVGVPARVVRIRASEGNTPSESGQATAEKNPVFDVTAQTAIGAESLAISTRPPVDTHSTCEQFGCSNSQYERPPS